MAQQAWCGTVEAVQDHLSLAVRYRPQRFADLIGQRHVSYILRRAVALGRVPQQLLFSGPSGVGKTTVARVLSAALICETPLDARREADPCGTCQACQDVLTPGRTHPDLVEIDAASNGGKDEIRDVASRAQLAPLRAPVKIFIIDEAHGLSGPGAQAALKMLEEPPSHVVFMLCTTDPQKMPKTVRGRCTEFELALPQPKELVTNLLRICEAEGWSAPEDVLAEVVASTDPDLGVRGTVSSLARLEGLLSDGSRPEALTAALGLPSRERFDALTRALLTGDRKAAAESLSMLRASASDERILSSIVTWCRDLYLEAVGTPGEDFALWRYDKAAGTSERRAELDLLVALIAHPPLEPSTELAAAQQGELERLNGVLTERINEVETVRAKLEQVVSEARQVGNALYRQSRQVPQRSDVEAATPPQGAAAPGKSTPNDPGRRATNPRPSETRPPVPSPASRPQQSRPATKTSGEAGTAAPRREPAAPSRQPSRPAAPTDSAPGEPRVKSATQMRPTGADGLTGAARALARELPSGRDEIVALLAACRVEFDDAVVVSYPPHLADEISRATTDLRRAAGQLGLALRLDALAS